VRAKCVSRDLTCAAPNSVYSSQYNSLLQSRGTSISSLPLVEVHGISKAFGGVQALSNVSLNIAPGEVHALVGENGAGKSTLIKVLSGYHRPESGRVSVSGADLRLGDIAASEAAGIAVIHQESTAFPHLNTEDNIFVGREPRRFLGLLDRPLIRRRTRELLERLGQDFNPRVPVEELTVAQRQIVGIARALSKQSRLLIMDEPTASLSSRETDILFRLMRQLRSEGVSVLYISHRLEEVFELSDRVTVLRDGQTVRTRQTAEVDRTELIRMMVGRELGDQAAEQRPAQPSSRVMLEVRNLSRAGVFENVSFELRTGEIVGLAGLVGAGRSEVARAIFGIDSPTSGTAAVDGRNLQPGSVRSALQSGVALVPEDRQHQGLVLPMSVGENLVMVIQSLLARCGFRSSRRERPVVEKMIRKLDIRAASEGAAAESLSGGNQQKLVLGKWLATEPRLLLLDEPTRGIDVAAKTEVHSAIRKLADDGMAVLLISSDLSELLLMSDRIVVMRAGSVAGELSRTEATQEKVLHLALPSSDAATTAVGTA